MAFPNFFSPCLASPVNQRYLQKDFNEELLARGKNHAYIRALGCG